MRLYNTLTRNKDVLVPLKENVVNLYTCGLTVYSQPHIGNWVAYIYWDILVRSLLERGYDVNRVQNITDVGHLTSDEDAGEDKMLKGALSEGITAWQVADKYSKIADYEAYELLDLIKPTHMPRATDYIAQQIAFVTALEDKGYTYQIADGIYFDTDKLTDYGKLAQLDIVGLEFGARVEDTGKKSPTDFALWKFSDPAEKRDMEWESPWGVGFPGWHLECSVMARELLGDQIDIHTGGIDHIPVHHTNEIAQTESVTNKQFSTLWLHANHIKVDGTKMSKSLGNIYTLQDILDRGYSVDAFKLLVLGKHYSTEGNFTWENLEAAQNRLNGFLDFADLQFQSSTHEHNGISTEYFDAARQKLRDILSDDLNTPQALASINESIDYIEEHSNGIVHKFKNEDFIEYLKFIDSVLGLHLHKRSDITADQKSLIELRAKARTEKDWATSDKIREQLLSEGLKVRDTVNHTGQPHQIWSRTTEL